MRERLGADVQVLDFYLRHVPATFAMNQKFDLQSLPGELPQPRLVVGNYQITQVNEYLLEIHNILGYTG